MVSEPILQIALAGPLRTLFDYLMPAGMQQPPAIGSRFLVPFGRGGRTGILLSVVSDSEIPGERLKRAIKQLDEQPLLTPQTLKILQWAANYYQHPLGDVIFQALPVNLRKSRHITTRSPQGWRLSRAGHEINPDDLKRAPKQQALMQTLAANPQGIGKTALLALSETADGILRILREKGWVERCPLPLIEAMDRPATPVKHPLNPSQQHAVDQISARLHSFSPILLNGVTGSGKTEVYLQVIENVVETGRQVLVLVPEIGLTPQLMERFSSRLGHRVALLHSGLADGEREQVWHEIRLGKKQVLVGTRSAVFTPMPGLGLIVVDEEHDLSYKQQEGFRYSARDLALVRAQQAECPVVLGSATPSLESLRNVVEGRYRQLNLPYRAANASLPAMHLVDIRSVPLDGGLSPALIREVAQTLSQGEQVMLFINRRGYAPMLTCHACGWVTDCPRCDARMTHHRRQNLLWCHHCGHQRRTPRHCPECGSPDLRAIGQGTEQIEECLSQRFPDTPLVRIDRDTTSRKGALEKILKQVHSGAYPLLLGTQMLAKGHHFPAVTLVGILDVDQGLFGADYRAPERMAQLILQVAGRAGRAERAGRVLIQTRHPDHPLMQLLIQQGYDAFAKEAMAERKLAMLPPFSHQVLVRAESTKAKDPMQFLQLAAEAGKRLTGSQQMELWGPVPAPMERRAGRIRAHLLIQSNQRGDLQRWLAVWINQISKLPEARKVRWSIDVDPMEML